MPLSIGAILLLLLANFRSVRDMLLAASAMPMALIGGIFALGVTGTPFSVSAAIGFVGLFGIAVMEGIIIFRTSIASSKPGPRRARRSSARARCGCAR